MTGLYAKLIAAAVIVAAVLGAVWYVQSLKGEIEVLTKDNTILKANQEVLTTSIESQNKSIDDLKAEADARLAAAAEDLAKAKAATVEARKKARVIYKTVPSTPGDACKSALDLINGSTK